MKTKYFRTGMDKHYDECELIPSLRFWHYEGHFGLQIEWIHWEFWVVIGKNW